VGNTLLAICRNHIKVRAFIYSEVKYYSTKMHISTKDKALTGLKEAHYFLINQPFKEDGEWEIIELIAKAITKLEKIKPGETDE